MFCFLEKLVLKNSKKDSVLKGYFFNEFLTIKLKIYQNIARSRFLLATATIRSQKKNELCKKTIGNDITFFFSLENKFSVYTVFILTDSIKILPTIYGRKKTILKYPYEQSLFF